jgi:hypothetical protein
LALWIRRYAPGSARLMSRSRFRRPTSRSAPNQGRVLGGALHQYQRALDAVDFDAQRDPAARLDEMHPVDHQRHHIQPGQVLGQQLGQRGLGLIRSSPRTSAALQNCWWQRRFHSGRQTQTVSKHWAILSFAWWAAPNGVGPPDVPRSSPRVGACIGCVVLARGGGLSHAAGHLIRPACSDARPHRSGVVGAVPRDTGSGVGGRAFRSPRSRRGEGWSVDGGRPVVFANAARPIWMCRQGRRRSH